MKSLHIIYSTDYSIADAINLNIFNLLSERLEYYSQFWSVKLLTQDTINFSAKFNNINIEHVSLGIVGIFGLRHILYYLNLLLYLFRTRDSIHIIKLFGMNHPSVVVFSKITRKPYIVSYNYDWSIQVKKYNKLRISGAFARIIQDLVLENAKTIIAVSRHIQINLNEKGFDNVIYIPNYVDINKFNPNSYKSLLCEKLKGRNKHIILSVGRLHKIKNFDICISAIKVLLDHQGSNFVKYILIGQGPEEEKLTKIIIRNNLSENVSIIPSIPNNIIHDYYACADLFLLCSSLEGNPKVILEALASGLPIIASDVDGIKQILYSSMNLLIDNPNPITIAHHVEDVLHNIELLDKMKTSSLEISNYYSKSTILKKHIFKLYS